MNAVLPRRWRVVASLLLILLLIPLPVPAPARAAGGTWEPAGRLTMDRHELFTATPLPDGGVLVAGGTDGAADWPNPLGTAERYDPATNAWKATGGMAVPRFWHTATALPDGRVVVIGGWSGEKPSSLASAVELYDPVTGTWCVAGALETGRWWHTATLLTDGTILVVGGVAASARGASAPATVERYDPATGVARVAAPLLQDRALHTATLLRDGTVLVVGGRDAAGAGVAAAERYDPRSDSWRPAGRLAAARQFHTATLLADGRVLVAGGDGAVSEAAPLSSAEIYDPGTDSWRAAGWLNARRAGHTMTALADGTVVALGGDVSSAERYLPAADAWVLDPVPAPAAAGGAAVLLADGSILAIGGVVAARYRPGATPAAPTPPAPFAAAWRPAGAATTPRTRPVGAVLADGTALIVGGNAGTRAAAERYDPAANAWHPAGSLVGTGGVDAVVALPDGGALVLGSTVEPCPCMATAERYDPATGGWRATAPPPRDFFLPQAAALPDGTILVIASGTATFRYDPVADDWRAAGDLPRYSSAPDTLVATPDGAAYLFAATTVLRYDPAGNGWRELPGAAPPEWDRAVALADGTILLVGPQEAGVYEPGSASWHPAPMMAADRGRVYLDSPYTLTALPGGLALAVGGEDMGVPARSRGERPPLASAEVYDAAAGAWRPTAPLGTARADHTALPLRDGSVLVLGGTTLDGGVAPPERFVPGAAPAASPSPPAGPPPGAGTYQITDLGPLVPTAINAAGRVAGFLPSGRAVVWREGMATELAGPTSRAYGINDRDWVVGFAATGITIPRAVLWRDGTALDLGTPAGPASEAAAINAAGQVAGTIMSGDGAWRAFRWQDGALTLLDPPPPGDVVGSWATGLNGRGDVIGGIGKGEPVVWRDGHLARLGTLAGWAGEAAAIDDAGQVVGVSGTPSGQDHAVLWVGGAARDLGTLGGPGSAAHGLNNRGQIVGTARTGSGAEHAFLYQAGAMADLNDLLSPGSGWELTVATAINDGGQIVGRGTVAGAEHGFLLAPVAPAARTFPETGQAVGPPFLAYWEAHGGLALNGYPLSPAFTQVMEDGKAYLVQYFERVRMEYHPENANPAYQVLIGQFGRRFHPADPAASQQAGATYFPETGHNVAGGFLAYWRANGGLAQFGHPLSEVISETLEDGKSYQVQYFERARFEYHPENAAPYDVLLGQFGRRILGER